jgi:hypothetical protein
MDSGYIKLWRKSIESGWLQNANLWTFWTWCLMKASHKECKMLVGFQTVDLNPGQFVFGRKKASQELLLSQQTIRTCLEKLKNSQNLTIKSTNKFSIISIVNWDAYQQTEFTNNHQVNQELTSKQPASNHKQECKECKEEKKRECIPDLNGNKFSEFWSSFPPRGIPPRRSGREKAFSTWKHLDSKKMLPEMKTILACLERDQESSQWRDTKYIPMASTWLNSKPWLDMEETEPESLYELGLRMLKENPGGT